MAQMNISIRDIVVQWKISHRDYERFVTSEAPETRGKVSGKFNISGDMIRDGIR
jgi:hypothetical protein